MSTRRTLNACFCVLWLFRSAENLNVFSPGAVCISFYYFWVIFFRYSFFSTISLPLKRSIKVIKIRFVDTCWNFVTKGCRLIKFKKGFTTIYSTHFNQIVWINPKTIWIKSNSNYFYYWELVLHLCCCLYMFQFDVVFHTITLDVFWSEEEFFMLFQTFPHVVKASSFYIVSFRSHFLLFIVLIQWTFVSSLKILLLIFLNTATCILSQPQKPSDQLCSIHNLSFSSRKIM